MVMCKSGGEILSSDQEGKYGFVSISMYFAAFCAAIMQGYMLNLSIQYYNQIDIMPIYQSFLLCSYISAGLILLDESKFYSYGQLL